MNYEELTVFSHGLGTDSCTILELMANDPRIVKKYIKGHCLVIFSDLGNEYPETYELIPRQEELCKKLGFDFIRLTSDMGFHPCYSFSKERALSIVDWWRNAFAIGMTSGDKRCTDRWKINPIWSFVSDYLDKKYSINANTPRNGKKALYEFTAQAGKINLILGFSKGEEKRSIKAEAGKNDSPYIAKNVNKFFPLIDLGFTRTDCHKYYNSILGKKPPRPSNCMFCFFQSPAELVYLFRNFPDKWKEWEELEKGKMTERGGNGVKGKFILDHYLQKALLKYGEFTDENLYKEIMVHGCSKGSW